MNLPLAGQRIPDGMDVTQIKAAVVEIKRTTLERVSLSGRDLPAS